MVDSSVAPNPGSLSVFEQLTVMGRADRVTISGDEKICLNEIEQALKKSQLNSDAIAFGVEDSEWGSNL